jgi:hypothetical protein
VASCAHCGATLPAESRYCAQCGNRSDAGGTKVMEVPANETGHVPVHYGRAEPRYYGLTPATLVLVLAGAAVTLAVVLFALGRWPLGLILLGVALLLVLVFLEVARRKPGGAMARSTAEALEAFRAHAGVAAGSLATRGRAAGRLITLRRELQRMGQLRAQLLFELGEAVYRGDEQATEIAREQVKELDELAAEREAEMATVVTRAQQRLHQRRLEVQPTEMVELPEEPSPPPGEATPPEPARIPEPYPPPDEATPPEPAVIPEPGPAVIPEPGPLAPEGDERR